MRCAFHPDRETCLSCGKCDRSVCVECVRQTPVGSRCLECLGGRRATLLPGPLTPPLPVDTEIRRRYLSVFFAVVLVNLLFAPLVLLPGIVISAVIGALRRLESAGRLLGGSIYFIGCWAVVIPTALPLTQSDGKSQPLVDMHVPATTAVFLLVAAALVVPLFWRPARRCAEQLVVQGRGAAAGLLLGTALAGTTISAVGALFFLFLSI